MKRKIKPILAIVIVICIGIAGFIGYRFWKQKMDSSKQVADEIEIEKSEFVPVSEKTAISETRWMAMLNEAFAFTDYTEYSNEKIKGSYAIVTGFNMLGGACIDYYLGDKEYTEDNIVKIAIDHNLIDENYVDSYIDNKHAEELIDNLIKLKFQEDYHVEKAEVNLEADVVDGQGWEVKYYNRIDEEDKIQEEVFVDTKNQELHQGEKIVYLDQNGIMHGGIISTVEQGDDGLYHVLTTPVETQEDIVDNYTVAGFIDWSILENSEDNTLQKPIITMCSTSTASGHNNSVDVSIKGTIGNDGAELSSVVFGGTTIYGNPSILDAVEDEDDEDEDKDSVSKSASGDFEILLQDLEIYVYAQDDNSIYLEASFNPIVKVDNLSAGVEIELPSIPLGLGVFSANLDMTVNLNTDLGISIEFASKNPVQITTNNNATGGSRTCNSNEIACDWKNQGLDQLMNTEVGEFTASAGINFGVGLQLCEVINVVEPNITATFVALGKKLDKIEGYDYSCYEVKVAGPIVEVGLASGGTLMDYFLESTNLPGTLQLNGINDDEHLLLAKYYHIELNPFNRLDDPKGNASVCTHYPSGEEHLEDEKIAFEYGDEGINFDAEYYVEINGEKFEFIFTSKEYEEEYLEFLNNLTKEDVMNNSSIKSRMHESDYFVDSTTYLFGKVDDKESYELVRDGEFCVINGNNLYSVHLVRIPVKVLGYSGSGGAAYFYGKVIGRIAIADQDRFIKCIYGLGDRTFTYRRPYVNMEKQQ